MPPHTPPERAEIVQLSFRSSALISLSAFVSAMEPYSPTSRNIDITSSLLLSISDNYAHWFQARGPN
jgi:hypothetical protein